MKGYALLTIAILLSFSLNAQEESRISQRVKEAKSDLNREFTLIENVFIPNLSVSIDASQFRNAESAMYFDYNRNTYSQFRNNQDKAIALQIPNVNVRGSNMILDLVDVSESFNNFSVTTSSGESFSGRELGGVHYRGIVRGKESNSLVALSVFENDISGIVSISGQGTINIGRLGNAKEHIIYDDANLLSTGDGGYCDTPEDGGQNPVLDDLYTDIYSDSAVNPEDNCLKVYFELDHDIYVYHNSSTPNTANFLIGIFNQVALLYMNESITMELSEIFIWDTPDSYSIYSNTGLKQFVAQRPVFNGDLAHLLTFTAGSLDPNNLGNAGGRANWFGGVCVTGDPDLSPHSYTTLFPEFVNYPVFSRQVKVITHEIGHNLGSRHTHACVWNGNMTAIDGCSGWTEGDCLLPNPIPNNTGTIMSYCDRNVGIDFTLGFGPQPGNLIRSFVSSLNCLDGCVPVQPCALTANVSTVNVNQNASTKSISVTSDGSWRVSDNSSWINLNTTNGTGNGTISYTVDANILPFERIGSITIYCNQTFITVDIIQSGDPNPPPCRERDSLALVALYNATGGPNWTNPWNLNAPITSWDGLEMSNEGCVTEIFLSENNLVGSLPPEIGNLLELRYLNLRVNKLSGFIPPEIGNLSNLTYIQFYLNDFSGSLPREIGNLANLEFLNLYDNELSGPIPPTLGNLTKLHNLYLSYNFFTGSIPPEFGSMSSLGSLHIDNNVLSGNIPPELGNLPNLSSLSLRRNFLSGSIPPEIGNISSLRNLALSNNRLSGCFDQNLANLCGINSVIIDYGNSFDAYWANFCNTGAGQCSSTPQTCRFSDSLALVSLYNATDGPNWVISWDLDQPIDNWYGITLNSVGCVNKIYLRLNELNGTLPAELGNINGLTSLNLIANQLTGSIPPEFGNLENLNFLGLAANDLSGCYDQNLMNLCDQLQQVANVSHSTNLDASWIDFCNTGAGECQVVVTCALTDSLALVSLYNATDGPNWTNSWNLNQPMSTWYGVLRNAEGCVSSLSLFNNQLNGTIPADLGNLSSLSYLNFNDNQLTGSIPAELGDLSNLKTLYLVDNQLSGTIPPELGNLSNITTFYIYDNQLSGSIPPELGNLSKLSSFGLHQNQLSGPIPPALGNLYNLTSMHLYSNQLSGSIPCEIGNLSKISTLNLHDNQLSGPIPIELGSLSKLSYLRLQQNQLTGSLPASIGNLSNLVYVQAFSNQLSGCYDQNLINLCSQVGTMQINIDNNFDAEWSDFCSTGSGQCNTTIGCRQTDSLALVSLYNATDGPNWVNSWNLNESMKFWSGVGTNTDGCVASLFLQSKQLKGTLPPEIGNLAHLSYLNVSNNQLSGSLPAELGDLFNMTNLNVNFNQLSGSIPAELGNLPLLYYLGLRTNQFSGTVPIELSNLSNLETLHIQFNQLSGPIPSEFGNLQKLSIVNMNDNQLSGPIPPEFGNLPALTHFKIQENQLSGCFDQNLVNLCGQLTSLDINRGNNFDASWSSFCSSGEGACTEFPVISDFPYLEGFETKYHLWAQDYNDDMDWTRYSGPTPSQGTGPASAKQGTHYMYTEASGNSNKQAILLSPLFDLSQIANPKLDVRYHMYGIDMGTLQIEISTDGVNWSSLFGPTTGAGIESWMTSYISAGLNAYASDVVQLRFTGTVGPFHRSDMAIDLIRIYNGDGGDEIYCPELLSVADDILEDPAFQALEYVSAHGKVMPSTNVRFTSGINIELLPEFEVKSGAIFHAEIGACR